MSRPRQQRAKILLRPGTVGARAGIRRRELRFGRQMAGVLVIERAHRIKPDTRSIAPGFSRLLSMRFFDRGLVGRVSRFVRKK